MHAPEAHAGLTIRLLGDFELSADGTTAPALESARAVSLLAYLLLNRDAAQSRQRIASALWPDSTEAQARTNLRHVLHNLRRWLTDPDRYLEITPRTVRWYPREPWWLDLAAFDAAASRAEGFDDGPDGERALREAVELYRGDLLPGWYDEWLEDERQRLRERFVAVLRRLATLLEARGELREAITYAERLLRLDPLAERAYRMLMRLHAASGDSARALRVYHACAATLDRELATEPSPATRMVYESLLAHRGSTAPSERAPRTRPGSPPLVGRGTERARLTEAWRTAAAGNPRFVLVTGEPGIGKTRLVEEFSSWCGHRGATIAQAGAYAAEGALAYGLVASWLRTDALAGHVRRLPPALLTELARLLPELLTPGVAEPERLAESEQRRRLFSAVTRAILAPGPPVLLVADDLHWSDPESLRFLHYLLRAQPDARLLVAATARLEDLPDRHLLDLLSALRAAGTAIELPLARFTAAETATLVKTLAGVEPDQATGDRLYRETEGNPLFVTEAVHAGWPGTEAGSLSPKVQAVIESRLARLSSSTSDLVGVAATIGRDFTAEILAEASGADEETLVRGLDELWQRRVVREHGVEGYDFTHGKIRDVVYASLHPARRRRIHRQVAQALRRRYAADPGPVSGRLAMHYEHAGDIDQAVQWHARAAEAAQALYAHIEAVGLLDHAVDLLGRLPETAGRDERELALQTAIAAPLNLIETYASPRLARVHQRALELAARLGTDPSPPLLRSVAVTSLSRGEFDRARRLATQLQVLGAHDVDSVLLVEAAYVLGITEFWLGNFPAAREHFRTAVAQYRPQESITHLVRYGLDPGVVCQSRLANTEWFLGDHGAAVAARDAALARADEVGHTATRATALVFAALLSLEIRDEAGVREYTAAVEAAPADESRVTGMTGSGLRGYLRVLDGEADAGLSRLRQALDEVHAVNPAPGARAAFLRILLAAATAAGDAQAGLVAADRIIAATDGVQTWEPEARRLRAEFLAASGSPRAKVRAELTAALATARRQHARLFELRAAASILRLGTEPADQARAQLSKIVEQVRETAAGTADLEDAVRLLSDSPAGTPAGKRRAERSRNAAAAKL